MRTLHLILTSVIFASSFFILTAEAECYGDAAEAYGCGSTMKREGTLERFGSSDSRPIIIDTGNYGHAKRSPYDDLFTPEEERRMFKSVVLGASKTNGLGNGYQNRSYRSNARALRTFRGRRIGGVGTGRFR
jgi:hypothetical protein